MPNELLLWQEMGALALSTQSYTMTVLTTQSYTMTVPTIQSHTMICSVCDRKQVCIHWLHNESSYYTILHNESSSVCDRKQVCVHWLHNPSSYTVRVLLSVTLSTQTYAMGALSGWLTCGTVIPVADGFWSGSWMWQGEGSFFSSHPLSQFLCTLSSACLAFV